MMYRILVVVVLAAAGVGVSADENVKFHGILEQALQQSLELNPEYRSYLGMKEDNHRWTLWDENLASRDHDYDQETLAALNNIDRDALDPGIRHQLDVARFYYEEQVARYEWRNHWYSLSQEDSRIDDITILLINRHPIDNEADARAYITRVQSVDQVVDTVLESVAIRSEKGIRPPSFVYPKLIENTKALLKGAPFDSMGESSQLFSSFVEKIDKLNLPEAVSNDLIASLRVALMEVYRPSLQKYIAAMESEQKKTDDRAGVWKLPDGKAFYQRTLARYTTTDLTASDIHEIGLNEVARLHQEIMGIMSEVGFKGSLQEFHEYMRTDTRWYYPETDQARVDYLNETNFYIDQMRGRIDDYFNLKPKAELIVKRVEAFREKNTSAAFYMSPSLDGSRPGTYYVPLYRMKDYPTWDLASTAFHEALPGHHMQIAIALELEGVPLPVRLMSFGAYTEGWALYAEYLAAETGVYDGRPYKNFGRLSAELFRAVRLVVDSGIHNMRWTREKAIDYMVTNTAQTRDYATGEIERYIVWPGQATSYKIGMLKILEARKHAEESLGEKFDIRRFHDIVLGDGAMPMSLLRAKVDQWVSAQISADGSEQQDKIVL